MEYNSLKKTIDIDEALTEMGGFGRHQKKVWLVWLTFLVSGSYVLFPMGYYELMPKFICNSSRGFPGE